MTDSGSTINEAAAADTETSTAPRRSGWVLASLIAVATVANLGLAVANIALPDIAGVIAVVLGAAVVFFLFPRNQEERRMLAEFEAEDTAAAKGKSAA